MKFAVKRDEIVNALTVFLGAGPEESLQINAKGGTLKLSGKRRSVSLLVDIIEPGEFDALTGRVVRLRALAKRVARPNLAVTIEMKKRHLQEKPRLTFEVKALPPPPSLPAGKLPKSRKL